MITAVNSVGKINKATLPDIEIIYQGSMYQFSFIYQGQTVYLLPLGDAVVTLTHWGRDKMAAISQTAISNAFSCVKI